MPRAVPAATATLRVLRFLASRTSPVPAGRIAEAVGLPRSTTYHLLNAMAAESFVVHFPEEHTWGMGVAAWEVGQGFTRQEPLARLARLPLARLVDEVHQPAHLAVLHGSDVLYIVQERAPGRPPVVTDVGVRLPAHLTASGRAIMAGLPRAQVRALYPSAASFVDRTGAGPRTPAALRRELRLTAQRGYAWEDSEVTPGFSSVAIALRVSSALAAVAVTWDAHLVDDVEPILRSLRLSVDTIEQRLR
ncbi:MAG: IclR family transcriptional regulator [Propionibacteriaceae bacterium]|nr:IclR family transcriptional regulator [Propionibacteriaceae bacterium]